MTLVKPTHEAACHLLTGDDAPVEAPPVRSTPSSEPATLA